MTKIASRQSIISDISSRAMLSAGMKRSARSPIEFAQLGPKEFHHQDVVVVAPAVLQRVDLMAVLDKACLGVEPARGLVLGDDGELKLLDMAGRVRHGSIDQAFADAVLAGFMPHIHTPDHGLVAQLGVGMRTQPDDTDQPLGEECAEDLRQREQLLEPVQRPVLLILERRGERFRILAQPLEADVPVSRGIAAGE